MTTTIVKIGPVGCKKEGEEWDHKGRTKVVQIFASFGSRFLKSLWFQYLQDDGVLATSEIIGRQTFTASTFQTIVVNYPREYITKVTGYCSDYIEELGIWTNTSRNQPHVCMARRQRPGSVKGKRFVLDTGKLNQFGGFHGTHDDKGVRSIGLYLNPSPITLADRPINPMHRHYDHDDAFSD